METVLINNIFAVFIGSSVLLIALYFSAKGWISSATTLVLLLFALVVGLAIANFDLIRYHLQGYDQHRTPDLDLKITQLQEQMILKYEDLKGELEIQKREIENLQSQIETIKNAKSDL